MDIPGDILEAIFLHLPIFDIARSRAVCRFWTAVLRSRLFLLKLAESNTKDWLALFSYTPAQEKRELVLYNDVSCSWHTVSLDFLPTEFTDLIAADGGLMCIAGQSHGIYKVCVCNPVSRTYKILPSIDEVPHSPAGAMTVNKHKIDEVCSYEIAVPLVDAIAFISSSHPTWVRLSTQFSMSRNPVIYNGVLYALEKRRSPYCCFVYTGRYDLFAGEVWRLFRPYRVAMLNVLRQPCLLQSDGCFIVVGGVGLYLPDSYIAWTILKLDLTTWECSKAVTMPREICKHFDFKEDISISTQNGRVYFFNKATSAFLVCKLADGRGRGASWQWVEDCPSSSSSSNTTLLSKGFVLKLGLDRCS
ncbi:hypothetical protein KP509_18G025800 [Ceratopteris richardii]|uniref:F-box domain-containing protein n=1 Tax=Ceratopteris richardii TaxID=49495 RepID=A0A8T2SPU7_CERRI|nr:hypothetical protein KP509_18G025700 [Ceratopteris richardii]KAH7365406.1 hypothetical protein KP509_18G025800 [Ceratopteris richardii]